MIVSIAQLSLVILQFSSDFISQNFATCLQVLLNFLVRRRANVP